MPLVGVQVGDCPAPKRRCGSGARVILRRQHIAHDHVDLAGLLVDDLHQIVHGFVLAAQQPAAPNQIDGGDTEAMQKRLG